MPTIVFALLCTSLVVGAVLVALGRRGRRLNDHPVCRWCGFDVSGTYPASSMCPECGGGLKRENGVRIGVRKRMVSLMVVGTAMVLLPLAPMGIAFYGVITGANLNTWKPVGILLWEAGMAGKTASEAIAKELVDRLTVKSLSKEQEESIAARVVELQKDAGFAWTDGWGEVCDQLKVNDAMTRDQWTSLIRHCILNARLEARSSVRGEALLALRLTPGVTRLPASTHLSVQSKVDSVEINGVEAERVRLIAPGTSWPTSSMDSQIGHFTVVGSAPTVGYTRNERQDTGLMVRMPPDLGPGLYTVAIRYRFDSVDMNNSSLSVPPYREHEGWKAVTTTVRVTEAAEPFITPLERSDALQARTESALRSVKVTQHTFMGRRLPGPPAQKPRYGIGVTVGNLPQDIPLAFEVYARFHGRESFIGYIATSPIVDRFSQVISDGRFGTTLKTINEPWFGSVDLILRPREDAAAATLDMTSYYNSEIVLHDVPILDSQGQPVTEPPKSDPEGQDADKSS